MTDIHDYITFDGTPFFPGHSCFIMAIIHGSHYELEERFKEGCMSQYESDFVNKLYKDRVKPLKHIPEESVEHRIIAAMIFQRLKINNIYDDLYFDQSGLEKVLMALLSLKTDKTIRYEYYQQIQIAHAVLYSLPMYADYYQLALKLYTNDISKNPKLLKKLAQIKSDGIPQAKNNAVIECVLLELNVVHSII